MPNETQAKTAFTDFIQIANDAMKSGMSLASQSPQQVADAWLRLGSEYLRFASHRFAAQAELFHCLRNCPDVETVVSTETRFFENAADDYTQELDRLAEVARNEPDVSAAGKHSGTGNGKAAAKAG